MKKKRISPPRVSDEDIKAFASNNQCNIVEIIRKAENTGTSRLYIKYICKCNPDRIHSAKWHRFHNNPQCKFCNKGKKLNDRKQTILNLAKLHKCTIVNFEYNCDHLYVHFVCGCGNKKVRRKRSEKFESSPMCKLCIYEKNPRVSDEDIKKIVIEHGRKYINHWRLRKNDKQTKIIVEFICGCGNKNICMREIHSLGNGCNLCKDTRRKETVRKKYGVDHVLQSDIVRNKIQNTNLEKYGVKNILQSEIFRDKIIETNNKKYGVDHWMQNSTMRMKWEKCSYKHKKYVFPSGRTIIYQGYENWAIELLLLSDINENDILTDSEVSSRNDIPAFWYEHDGVKRRYYPDIYVISERKFIEVKSTYTANYKPDIIQLKKLSILKAGYNFELWVFDSDGYPNIQ